MKMVVLSLTYTCMSLTIKIMNIYHSDKTIESSHDYLDYNLKNNNIIQ